VLKIPFNKGNALKLMQKSIQQKNKLVNFERQKTQKVRLENPGLSRALYGLIAFFEDQQIRDRQGRHSSLYHSSESNIAPKSRIMLWSFFNIKYGTSLPMFLKVRNKEGEWASQMHALPKYLGKQGKTPITVQDSNLFITGFCSFPLLLISEQSLPVSQRIIAPILKLSLTCVKSFKRGKAYNFWPKQTPVYGKTQRTGPLNIWIEIANSVIQILTSPRTKFLSGGLNSKLALPTFTWLAHCLDEDLNPNGSDAIFNVANDAEDSSAALAFEYLFNDKKFISKEMELVIKEIINHRDIDRDDIENTPFEAWKGINTGAYLTWLKKESSNPFSYAENGLIPTGKNNIDIVVNANVFFTLSLLGKTDSQGYQDCEKLLCRAVNEKSWPGAGLYYPQQMMFPYAFTRAIHDGGARSTQLLHCQEKLLLDVLALAKNPNNKKLRHFFYFEGGLDESTHLSTALGLTALLNMGEETAKRIKKLEMYQKVVEGCVEYLLAEVQYKRCRFQTTQVKFSANRSAKFVAHWEDGLFFGPVHSDLCHWRSQAVTHASVLEAFAKYLLTVDKEVFDKNKTSQTNKTLNITSYELVKQKSGQWLNLV